MATSCLCSASHHTRSRPVAATANLRSKRRLMVEVSLPHLAAFADAGCDLIIVHVEACTHLHQVPAKIADLGVHAGVVMSPAKSASCPICARSRTGYPHNDGPPWVGKL